MKIIDKRVIKKENYLVDVLYDQLFEYCDSYGFFVGKCILVKPNYFIKDYENYKKYLTQDVDKSYVLFYNFLTNEINSLNAVQTRVNILNSVLTIVD